MIISDVAITPYPDGWKSWFIIDFDDEPPPTVEATLIIFDHAENYFVDSRYDHFIVNGYVSGDQKIEPEFTIYYLFKESKSKILSMSRARASSHSSTKGGKFEKRFTFKISRTEVWK